MKTIWKYPVPFEDSLTIEMPAGAEPLTVQMQLDMPTMWALVRPDAKKVATKFRWYPTGGNYCSDHDNKNRYVGTVQWKSLAFHLFKV